MQAEAVLDYRLTGLRRRVRLLLAERTALAAGTWAAVACLALVGLDKFRLARIEWDYLAAILALGLAGGWAWGFFHRPTTFEVSRAAEKRLSLKERLSSAVALQRLSDQDEMVAALLDDAAERLRPVRPSRLFPRRFGRRGQVFVGLLVVVAAALILPELSPFQSAATRRERGRMRAAGERLVKLAHKLEARPVPGKAKILKQLALNMKALGKDMQTGRATRKQAFVRLHRLENQVKLAQRELAGPQGEKPLAQAATEMKMAQDALARMRMMQKAKILAQLKAAREAKAAKGGGKEGKGATKPLTDEQVKALERLAAALKPSTTQELLKLPEDLASTLAKLLAKKDMQEALKILQRLAEKLQKPETLRKLTLEQMRRLAEELRMLAGRLKKTDLDALARQMLALAKALERGDIKLAMRSANRVGGT